MTFFFAWFGFSVLFGAFAASFLNPLHSFVLFGILIFASLCFRVCFKKLRDFSAVVLAVALGFFIVAFELITEFYPAAALDGTSGSITGTVTEVSVSGGNPVFTVKTDSIDIEGAPQKITLKLSGWDENAAKPYDKIFCKVNFAAYGEKDGTEFITDRSRGISVYAYSKEALEVTGEDRTFPGYIIYRIREEISSVIYEYFIGWHAPFMEQILIGTRGKLESEITETFRQSGISHILAVSGLHMVIVIFLFEKLIKIAKRKNTLEKHDLLILIFAVLTYMLIGGMGVSIRRAGTMLIVRYAAKILLYGSHSIDNLGIAVTAVLVTDPMAACDAGFLMSAFSCLAICVFAAPLKEFIVKKLLLKTKNRVLYFAAESFAVSTSAFFAVLPVSAAVFKEIYPVALVSNIFASVFAAPIIILGIATVILGLLPVLDFFAGGTAVICMVFSGMLYRIADFFAFEGDFMFNAESPWVLLWIFGSAVLIIVPALASKSFKYIPFGVVLSVFVLCGGIFINYLLFSGSAKIEISAIEHGTAVECSKGKSRVLVTHGLDADDKYNADFASYYDVFISLDAFSGAAEAEIASAEKTKLALLSMGEAVERCEGACFAKEGEVSFWENGKVHIISSGVFCVDAEEISLLYISEECDIMDIEPKFRKADIIIFDGVSPAEYPSLRCEYMILRQMEGFFSGAAETATLKKGSMEFYGYDGNIRKGWLS